ncbi:MAG: phosphatase PAP2 family protein [bacterium]|nr:phosphatase PAP2 family protein [bacterium]
MPNIAFLHSHLPDLMRYDVNFGVACFGSSVLLMALTHNFFTLKRKELWVFILVGTLLEIVFYMQRLNINGLWLRLSHIGPGYLMVAFLLVLRKTYNCYRDNEGEHLIKYLEIIGLGLCMPCVYTLSGGLIGLRGERYVYDGMLLTADSLTGTQPAFIITEFLRTFPVINLFMTIVYDYLGMWMLLSQVLVYLYERNNADSKPYLAFFPVLTYAAVVLLGMHCYVYFPAVGTEYFCGTAVFPHGPYPKYSLDCLPKPVAAPPFLARNAMPSLHLSWIICAYLGICRIKKSYAYVGLFFVVLTLLSAFSIGCHWLTDFIVALPFTVLCASLTHLRLKFPYRLGMMLWGGGVSFIFMYFLKHHIDLVILYSHYYLIGVCISSFVSVLLLYAMVYPRKYS